MHTLHNRFQNLLKSPRQHPAVEFGKGCCGSDPQIAIIEDEQAKHPKKPSKPQRLSTVGCATRTFASPLQPINFSSFPRSSRGNAYRSCLGNQRMGSHGGPWEPEKTQCLLDPATFRPHRESHPNHASCHACRHKPQQTYP